MDQAYVRPLGLTISSYGLLSNLYHPRESSAGSLKRAMAVSLYVGTLRD